MGKAKEQQETAAQRALVDVARQQVEDFETRWRPVQTRLAQGIVEEGQADSFTRRRADTMAKVDTGVAFAGAREKANEQAADAGQFGTGAHKLALTGMAEDQATSSGLSAVAADQAVTDQTIQGLGAVTAMGRGEKATAMNGLAQAADMSGRQAAADAQASFDRRMGTAQVLGKAAGFGLGAVKTGALGGAMQPGMTNDIAGVNGSNAMDQWLTYGVGGD